jgi:hypothetical protein
MAELWMANAYPGLYDGLISGATFPDAPVNEVLDLLPPRGRGSPG